MAERLDRILLPLQVGAPYEVIARLRLKVESERGDSGEAQRLIVLRLQLQRGLEFRQSGLEALGAIERLSLFNQLGGRKVRLCAVSRFLGHDGEKERLRDRETERQR